MPTFLFSEHVFGPIKSRRLGSSLGINLLSVNQKVCDFDCVYCECGASHPLEKKGETFVDYFDFQRLLKNRLIECVEQRIPIDAITFAGNGEPTLHPQFLSITKFVIEQRDKYFPDAKIAVLTNGVTLKNKRIQEALKGVDKAIIKLDAGTEDFINKIDQPKRKLNLSKMIEEITSFDGEIIIQTMFLKGILNGETIDNSSGTELEHWLKLIQIINPVEVMLYSIDRDTPIDTLERVPKKILEQIAERIHDLGIKTQVV